MLAIDQDRLGKQATPVWRRADHQVWLKELADGSRAIGVFNLGDATRSVDVPLREIGLKGSWSVRDVWRQKALAPVKDTFTVKVPGHGAVLLRLEKRAR